MKSLAEKLYLKKGATALIVNAPPNYLQKLSKESGIYERAEPGSTYDFVQLFVQNSSELITELEWLIPCARPDTVFWIAYPKKGSGIPSDLEMMKSWGELSTYGYTGVSAASIDEVWTALRWKPESLVRSDDACNENIPHNQYGEFIDLANRTISLPPELKSLLEKHSSALSFFQTLSFTNRKEYVVWFLSAKQQKTRDERLKKILEKLSSGKKNPSGK